MAVSVKDGADSLSISPSKKFLNVAGLAIGFALGQGITFLTQTYLLAQGHAELIGELAVGLGIVTLAQWLADLGGLHLMCGRHKQPQFIWSAICGRFCVSILLVMAIPLCTTWVTTPFAQGIISSGRFVAIIWAFNLTGLLDGAHRSGKAGLVSFGPWLLANVATICVVPQMSFFTGQIVGMGFVVGAVATVMLHFFLARDIISIRKPSLSSVLWYLQHGSTCALTHATSLTYNRILLFFVYATCDPITTGSFALTRSIISSLQQAISFVRRVEYPDLVASEVRGLQSTIRMQRSSISTAALAAIAVLCSYPVAHHLLDERFHDVLRLVAIFVATLPFWSLSSALGQQFLAKRRTRVNFFVTLLGSGISLTLSYFLLTSHGIVSIAFSELIMFVSMFFAYFMVFRRAFA